MADVGAPGRGRARLAVEQLARTPFVELLGDHVHFELAPWTPARRRRGWRRGALVAWSEGRHRSAAERFDEAAATWEGNLARDAWRCRLGGAETRRLAGDVAGAAERYGALLAEGRAIGIVSLTGPAESGLRRCGVDPGPPPVPELTARQHEVLQLVASGATSTDIAARRRTATRRLGQLRRDLGVASTGALLAALRGQLGG